MSSITTEDSEARRRRRRVTTEIKESLRELSVQLGLLNHHVGAHLELRGVDIDCLDIISRHGPLSPSALARYAGLHPATMTGILDRLERGQWIVRERDPKDRRAVVVRMLKERTGEVFELYSGMNGEMDGILGGYDDKELAAIADFVRRTTEAGKSATDELAGG